MQLSVARWAGSSKFGFGWSVRPVNALAASLSPLRILDAMTDRLGAFLLGLVEKVGVLTRYLASLPAGIQVVVAIGTMIALGVLAIMTLSVLSRARGIVGNVRQANAKRGEARESLPVADRHKAFGYVLALGLVLGAGVLLLFAYQSWRGQGHAEVPPMPVPVVGGFSGR